MLYDRCEMEVPDHYVRPVVEMRRIRTRLLRGQVMRQQHGPHGQIRFVERILVTLDAELLFTGVRFQPGKPLVFGRFHTQQNTSSVCPAFRIHHGHLRTVCSTPSEPAQR